ncbi:MAG: TlpA family protein disulfide reductase [Thermodesulfovibrionales bacterium]|nr:TlpA family protein disulfide reductase [Thermodesulfovibrionales bacterium]
MLVLSHKSQNSIEAKQPVYVLKKNEDEYIIRLLSILVFFALLLNPVSSLSSVNFCPFQIDRLIGERAPNFTLKNNKGNQVSLSSFKDKVIVLNFSAIWCPTCFKDLDSLNSLNQHLNDNKDIVILSVIKSKEKELQEALKDKNFTFDILIDSDKTISISLYKIFVFPTTFIVDKNGIIVKRYFGQQKWTDKDKIEEIKKILKNN